MTATRLNPAKSALGSGELTVTAHGSWTVRLGDAFRYGKVVFARIYVKPASAVSAQSGPHRPFDTNAAQGVFVSPYFSGHVSSFGAGWITTLKAMSAGTEYDGYMVALLP